MKKVFLFVLATVVAFTFTACNDDEPKGDGNGSGNSSAISRDGKVSGNLKLVSGEYDSEEDEYKYTLLGDVTNEVDMIEVMINNNWNVLGEYEVIDGKFSFTLDTPSADALQFIFDEEDEDVIVSNKEAKGSLFYMRGNKNDQIVGYIERIKSDLSQDVFLELIYVTEDVSITGSYTDEDEYDGIIIKYVEEYNVNLKKGWNTIVCTETVSGNTWKAKYTANNEPSNMIWILEVDNLAIEDINKELNNRKRFLSRK